MYLTWKRLVTRDFRAQDVHTLRHHERACLGGHSSHMPVEVPGGWGLLGTGSCWPSHRRSRRRQVQCPQLLVISVNAEARRDAQHISDDPLDALEARDLIRSGETRVHVLFQRHEASKRSEVFITRIGCAEYIYGPKQVPLCVFRRSPCLIRAAADECESHQHHERKGRREGDTKVHDDENLGRKPKAPESLLFRPRI